MLGCKESMIGWNLHLVCVVGVEAAHFRRVCCSVYPETPDTADIKLCVLDSRDLLLVAQHALNATVRRANLLKLKRHVRLLSLFMD